MAIDTRKAPVTGCVLALLTCGSAALAQMPADKGSSQEFAVHAQNNYQVATNVTYLTATGYESKLDVYSRRGATTPQPTVVFFHGGFWAAGAKENAIVNLLPWFEMGWNVVNVEYRLARVAPAPAAVEDAICALRFLATQARTYNIDVARIVTYGESAGGHLALSSAMIPESAGLDRSVPPPHRCPRSPRWSISTVSPTLRTSSTARTRHRSR